MSRRAFAWLGLLGVACATPAQVRDVENQVILLRAENARADSIRSRQFADVVRSQQRLLDSLSSTSRTMTAVRGDLTNDLYKIQEQLVQLQELTGQSQRRLSELRAQLEARSEQLQQQIASSQQPTIGAATPGDSTAEAPMTPPMPSAAQMYEASLGLLRRGSAETARAGFRELVKAHPADERVPDALYFIGQSFADAPDSAAAYYTQVADGHPQSSRAASAVYNLGLVQARQGNKAAARASFDRVVKQYPRSDEAALARDQLKTLR